MAVAGIATRLLIFKPLSSKFWCCEAIQRGVRHIYLILDNGSTHAPKQLQAWLTQKQVEFGWPFTIEPMWLPKYASVLDQIEIWCAYFALR